MRTRRVHHVLPDPPRVVVGNLIAGWFVSAAHDDLLATVQSSVVTLSVSLTFDGVAVPVVIEQLDFAPEA